MRILAVDDDELFLDLLTSSLAEQGFTDVVRITSGEAALDLIDGPEAPFDCYLLDIFMPDMDGIELCAELRTRPACQKAPVIMLTSADAKKYMPGAFDAGATDFLNKPLDIVELEARIKTAMMLVEVTSRDSESRRALQSLMRLDAGQQQYDAGLRITFSDIEPMRDYYQLENKLLKLGEGLYSMTLMSVQIRNFRKFAAEGSRNQTVALVHAVGHVLATSVPQRGFSFAYVGHGRFICLVLMRNPIVAKLLQSRMNDKLAMCLREREGLAADDVRLEVKALSNRRIMPVAEATRLFRKEIGELGRSDDTLLPPVDDVARRIFKGMNDREKSATG